MEGVVVPLLLNTSSALVLTGLALLAARLRASPAFVHGLLVVALLELVAPPLFTIAVALPDAAPPAEPVQIAVPDLATELDVLALLALVAPVEETPAAGVPQGSPFPWLALAGWAWLAGALACALRIGRDALRFRRALRSASTANDRVTARARALAKRLGLRRLPAILTVPGRMPPMVFCFLGRPRVLLPRTLLATLDDGALDTLLAHELAHVRRGDHLVRHLELLARCVHWWNPAARFVARRLRRAEEDCCDAWVVWALPDARRRYADALVGAVELANGIQTPLPAAASGLGAVDDLKRRLEMIMQGESRRIASRAGRLAVLAFGAVVVPLAPAFAQGEEIERARAAKREAEIATERAHAESAALRDQIEEVEERKRDVESRLAQLGEDDDDPPQKRMIASLKAAIEALEREGKHDDAKMVAHVLGQIAHPRARKKGGDDDAEHLRMIEMFKKAHDSNDDEAARTKELHARMLAERKTFEKLAKDEAKREAALHDHATKMHAELEARSKEIEAAHNELALTKERVHGAGADVSKLHDHLLDIQKRSEDRVERLEQKVDQLTDTVRELADMARSLHGNKSSGAR